MNDNDEENSPEDGCLLYQSIEVSVPSGGDEGLLLYLLRLFVSVIQLPNRRRGPLMTYIFVANFQYRY
jgi:hypothetical protein